MINILVIVLAATLAGMRGWDAMVVFALGKFDLLSRFLDLSGGVPSADTLRRVFERLDREELKMRPSALVRNPPPRPGRGFRGRAVAAGAAVV